MKLPLFLEIEALDRKKGFLKSSFKVFKDHNDLKDPWPEKAMNGRK